MTNVNKIVQSPWDFTLYKVDDQYILGVAFCEQVTDYSIYYKLIDDEIKNAGDISYLSDLAKNIRMNRETFSNREVSNPIEYK